MRILYRPWSQEFQLECECGFQTGWNYTMEATGREADLHMAAMYPLGTERRPCGATSPNEG